MMIKTIIFDLDDTLFSTFSQLHLPFLKESLKEMIKEGFKCGLEEGFEELKKISLANPLGDAFKELAEKHDGDKQIAEIGLQAYKKQDFDTIVAFPNVNEILKKLKKRYSLVLLTAGEKDIQEKKINSLGIKDLFDLIILCEEKTEKEFEKAVAELDLNPKEAISIGNRIDLDIALAKKLGMMTIHLKHGKYSNMIPENDYENADYTLDRFSQALDVIHSIENEHIDDNLLRKGPKVVAIGGGTGLPTLLEGIKRYTNNITAIVTVTDSGRSSGRLREEFGVLPPGDIRNCLIALSRSQKLVHDIFQYRFEEGKMKGHTIGNLFITALTKMTGSFEKSIRETSRILDLRGKVLPSTTKNIHLCAELEDGTTIEGEANVRQPGKSSIKKVFIKPELAEPLDETLEDIRNADVIILGPGALYTSIIPNLLIKGIPEALKLSKAKKIYICNIMTQPGATGKMTASEHVQALENHLGKDVLDYVFLNNKKPIAKVMQNYKKEDKSLVVNDSKKIEELGIKVVEANLIEKILEKRLLWEKHDLLRHDSSKLAKMILKTLIREKIYEVTRQNEGSDTSCRKRNKNASFDKGYAKGSS
jgi:uncharacterized cofD-like protein